MVVLWPQNGQQKNAFYAGLPSAPTNLTMSYTDEKIQLLWEDNASSEEFYIIEKKHNDGSFMKLDSVASNMNTYENTFVAAGLYEYRIYAVNPGQKSAYSNKATY